jgi:hypothetical protein
MYIRTKLHPLLSLELCDISVEELEQRLELATVFLNDCAQFVCPDYDGQPECPSNSRNCETY